MSNTFLFGFVLVLVFFSLMEKCVSAGMFWLLFNNTYSIHSSTNVLCFFSSVRQEKSQEEALKGCGVEWGSIAGSPWKALSPPSEAFFLCRKSHVSEDGAAKPRFILEPCCP